MRFCLRADDESVGRAVVSLKDAINRFLPSAISTNTDITDSVDSHRERVKQRTTSSRKDSPMF